LNTYDVVVGATRKSLTIPITDAQDVAIPLTGASANLIGWSPDLPGVGIDLAGTITNGPGGEVTFYSIGSLVDIVILGAKPEATFYCRVEWQDLDGKDFTEELALRFIRLHDSTYVLSGSVLAEGGHPWEFPFPTGDARMRHAGPVLNTAFSNGARVVLFSAPAGASGIVRDVSWVASLSGGPALGLRFEVTVDGEVSPCISIPLLTTIAAEYPLSMVADVLASTPAFEGGGRAASAFGHLRLPMPYSNGIEIAVVAPANAEVYSLWTNTIYQDLLPGCWNSNLRLRAARTDELSPATIGISSTQLTDATHLLAAGTLPADLVGHALATPYAPNDMLVLERTDDLHAVVSAQDTIGAPLGVPGATALHYMHEFLTRPAGSAGWLAMMVGGFENIQDMDILFEGNVRIMLDQNAEADLTWTSVEDFANGAYYFTVKNQFEDGGIMSLSLANGQFSIYKVFRNFPIRYADGVRAMVPNWARYISTRCNWTTFFYEESA